MAISLFEDDKELNEHEIAWMSKDYDKIQELSDSFKESSSNHLFSALDKITLSSGNMTVEEEDVYSKFWIDNALSQYVDCIIYANMMNLYGSKLPDSAHFLYYRNAISKEKRFGKWASYKDPLEEKFIVALICKYQKVSEETAKMYIRILREKNKLNGYLSRLAAIATDDFMKSVSKNAKDIKTMKNIVEKWKNDKN